MFKYLAVTTLLSAAAFDDTDSAHSRFRRIINGSETFIEYFPYQVSLGFQWFDPNYGYRYSHHCGGCIITKSWVLTAAHCLVPNNNATEYINTVKAGTTNQLDQPTGYLHGVSIHEIALFIIHPWYKRVENGPLPPHDIALLLVKQPFVYGPTRQPIALYRWDQKNIEGVMATVSGWGSKQSGGIYSEKLNALQLPIISKENCIKAQPYSDGQICAGYPSGNSAGCRGDSGGPVTISVTTRSGWERYLVGVVAGGPVGCILPGQYSIFTDVAFYFRWIEWEISERCYLPM